MKIPAALLLLTALGFAAPAKKVTNREFDDGSGSSKEVDPEKRQAIETFYDAARRTSHKVVYQLDENLQPISGVFYNRANKVFQKSHYKLDGAFRIIQEVIYDPNDRLVCTKNYVYGIYKGKEKVVEVDTYDANGRLLRPKATTGKRR